MKIKGLSAIFWVLALGLSPSCSKNSETEVNKRTPREAEGANADPNRDNSGNGFGSGDAMGDVTFGALSLQLAKNSENLGADFVSNVVIVNKTKEDQTVIFGKGGRSWVYGAPDKAPQQLEPSVVVAEGSQLLTLPDGEFWVVRPEELGRRKAGSVDQGSITIERFSLATVQGNKEKIKVLFAGATDIILHLETHLAVLSVKEGQAILNQFEIAKLPVNPGASIKAAGRGANGSFWFASGDQVALVEPKAEVFSWKKIKIPLAGYEDYLQFAAWPDLAAKMVMGDAVLLQGDKFWSVSGAPIAAAP